MSTSTRGSRAVVPWLLMGGLMVAACTDSTEPGPDPGPAVKLITLQPRDATAGMGTGGRFTTGSPSRPVRSWDTGLAGGQSRTTPGGGSRSLWTEGPTVLTPRTWTR